MDQNNQNNNQNQNQNNQVNPRTIEATVIGHLRTEKIGNPILAIEILGLVAVVMLALNPIRNMLYDENSLLYQLLNGSNSSNDDAIITTTKAGTNYLDGSIVQNLNTITVMKYESIIMSDFTLKDNTITCKIRSFNSLLDLDSQTFYLEVYTNTNKNDALGAFKLVGSYDYQDTEVTLKSGSVKFNESASYVGKIVQKTEDDYPKVNIQTNEAGVGTLTCTQDARTIAYTFSNNYLIGINDIVQYDFKEKNDYTNKLAEYEKKAEILGSSIATLEENASGFIFKATFNDITTDTTYPEGLNDYDYYTQKNDTDLNMISYAMTGKGYVCK